MTAIGLVLGAGGVVGGAYHAAALAALENATGWDARTADLIVGTSAGAGVAAGLRAGIKASEVGKKTNIIKVTYKSTNPVLASEVVNTLIQAYLDQTISFKTEEASRTVKFVEQLRQYGCRSIVITLEPSGTEGNYDPSLMAEFR